MEDQDHTALIPPASAFEDAIALIKLAADPKGFQARLDQLTAAIVKANEAKAGAERAKAAQAARDAELDKCEAELDARRSATGPPLSRSDTGNWPL